jgi:P-type conjugative transfer protein TrbJ
MLKMFLVVVFCYLSINTSQASGLFTGATEFTQILNNSELVSLVSQGGTQISKLSGILDNEITQTAKQIEEVQNQIRDLTGYSKIMAVWTDVEASMIRINNLVNRGQAIAYTLSNIDTAFRQRFPDYGAAESLVNYSQQYRNWSTSTLNGISSALQYAGLQAKDFSTEAATIAKIKSLSNSADGTVKAVQAANMIAAQQVEQLQKLRVMQMEQFNAEANYMATQQKTKDSETEALRMFLKQGKGHIRNNTEDGFMGF